MSTESSPSSAALARARRHLDKVGAKDVTLIITGGLRVPEDFAKAMMMGADAIAVHFRLRSTPYSIPASWEYAEKIKERINLVLIGNGDIFDYQAAIKKLNIVDGIMIGRGAISNPLIFSEIEKRQNSTKYKSEIFLKLIDLIEHYYEEKLKLPKLKPFIRYMISDKPDSKALRLKLYKAKDIKDAKSIFISYL